jgi:hypothetical protein
MIGQGNMPKAPLRSVTHYVDWMTFEQLPYAGGTADQPADLMMELRYIHAIVTQERDRQQKQQQRNANSRRRQRQELGV